MIAPGKSALSLKVSLPSGYKFAADAPQFVDWKAEDEGVYFLDHTNTTMRTDGNTILAGYECKARDGKTALTFTIAVYFCENNSDVCLVDMFQVKQPIVIQDGGSSLLEVEVGAQSTRGEN